MHLDLSYNDETFLNELTTWWSFVWKLANEQQDLGLNPCPFLCPRPRLIAPRFWTTFFSRWQPNHKTQDAEHALLFLPPFATGVSVSSAQKIKQIAKEKNKTCSFFFPFLSLIPPWMTRPPLCTVLVWYIALKRKKKKAVPIAERVQQA